MLRLNLPEYDFSVKSAAGGLQIFDATRKRWVALTPEEWVRQNFLQYLIIEKNFPRQWLAVEMTIPYNTMLKRGDIVLFGKNKKPVLLVECKAPHVKISQAAFDQAARYNLVLGVCYLIITNGMEHYCCSMNHENRSYTFLKEVPAYSEVEKSHKLQR